MHGGPDKFRRESIMVWLDLGQGEEGDQVGRLVGARWHGALNALGRTRKGIWNRVQRVELR